MIAGCNPILQETADANANEGRGLTADGDSL